MLVAALSTNLAINIIWIPMMHVIFCLTQESSKWVRQIETYYRFIIPFRVCVCANSFFVLV